jgi:RNA polymerase sigma-70 factor (ECF subfamily)
MKKLIERGEDNWNEELIQKLLKYLKDLPTEMLHVLELRFFENKDFKEIAYILEISESGAKMRTYRALDRLRERFNLRIKYDGKE